MSSFIQITPRTILKLNFLLIFLLTIGHLLFGQSVYEDTLRGEWGRFFSLDWEENLPTFFSVISLLFSSLLAILLSLIRELKRSDRLTWGSIGFLFLALAVDEWEGIHERLDGQVEGVIESIFRIKIDNPNGSYEFMLLLIAVILVILYSRFIFGLPKDIKNLIITAFAIILLGSIVLEFITIDIINISSNPTNLVYFSLATIEEILELTGIAIFNYALIKHILSYRQLVVKLPLSQDNESSI